MSKSNGNFLMPKLIHVHVNAHIRILGPWLLLLTFTSAYAGTIMFQSNTFLHSISIYVGVDQVKISLLFLSFMNCKIENTSNEGRLSQISQNTISWHCLLCLYFHRLGEEKTVLCLSRPTTVSSILSAISSIHCVIG